MTTDDRSHSDVESANPSPKQPVETTGDSDQEQEQVQVQRPDSPFDMLSTYRYFRGFIITSFPFGRLLWDILRISIAVLVISSTFFFLTGLSTPFVAVSSGSMEPNIMTGDMMIITEHNPDDPPFLAQTAGIVTVSESQSGPDSHTSFSKEGDVIVFQQEDGETPILHRAHFWVDEGENWVDGGDSDRLPSGATCDSISQCPAKQSGYITAGDSNKWYDQVEDRPPIKESEVIGVGQYRVPYLGWVRIGIDALT